MTEQIGQPEPSKEFMRVEPVVNDGPVETEHFRAKYAGFWTRFWAYTIDLLVLSAISGIFVKPIFRVADFAITNPSFLLFSPYKVTVLLILFLYFTLMTKFCSKPSGK